MDRKRVVIDGRAYVIERQEPTSNPRIARVYLRNLVTLRRVVRDLEVTW